MIKALMSMYSPRYPIALIYMLQSTEYNIGEYIKWLHRTKDFTKTAYRRKLNKTRRAKLLLLAMTLGMVLHICASLLLVYLGWTDRLTGGVYFGIAMYMIYPLVWPYIITLPVLLGRALIARPSEANMVRETEAIFAKHKAVKVAVVGSYGKTTMKELLTTVLGEGLKVAETPANKNVSISHAKFAKSLSGDEDVIIIEYGEGEPGDIAKFAKHTHPTHAVVTGLAPLHLDKYKTLQAAGEDIFSIVDFVPPENTFINAESLEAQAYIDSSFESFSSKGALGWKVTSATGSLEGTAFKLKKGRRAVELHSGLLGRHMIGFLAFVAAFALEQDLTEKQVAAGMAKTKPFEHRMQPYNLNGALVIDDTYNGNIEGIRAGLELLKGASAKRKVYVTPGLVDQGAESERVHREIGELIASAKPDVIILMKNSTTEWIKSGLIKNGFHGELRIEEEPLQFYTNLSHFVAAGDLVLMQNDWTDNYA